MIEFERDPAESSPQPPSADLPAVTIGTMLEPAFHRRLARALTTTAIVRALALFAPGEVCDLLIVDPRRVAGCEPEAVALRRHARAQVPCVFYTESTPEALRSVVAASDVMAVRLVLFDVDDSPETLREVVELAPRSSHALRLHSSVEDDIRSLLPSVRATLYAVLRKPEQFFDASDIASHAGLSRRHLDRVLTAANLAPAKNWIIGARAWHAVHLLASGRCSVESTAARLGYADRRALRRHFDSVWHASPTQLARADSEVLLRALVGFLRTREHEAAELAMDDSAETPGSVDTSPSSRA
jgi:AraC-like DNA-binding protein